MQCPKCGAENSEGTTVCEECNCALKTSRPEKKVGTFLSISLALGIIIMPFLFILEHFTTIPIRSPIIILTYMLLIILPFLSITSLIRINLNNDKLKGKEFSFLLLMASLLLIHEIAYYKVPAARGRGVKRIAKRVVCATNLKGLGTALMVYANDYDDKLPTGENWCDLLIEKADVSPKSFTCPSSDSVEGESDYAMNKHAAGIKLSEATEDFVVLFEVIFNKEGKEIEPVSNRKYSAEFPIAADIFSGSEKVYLDRWNQVAGPESLAVWRHSGACNIVFADGHVEFVKLPELSKLKWSIDGKESFPESFPQPESSHSLITIHRTTSSMRIGASVSLITIGIVCIIITAYILVKYHVVRYWKFALILGLLSAGTGWFFGNWAEEAYTRLAEYTGDIAGIFFGLLVGLCFAAILADCPNKLKQLRTFVGFSRSVGMLTGILCSTLVHIVLMIFCVESNPFGMIIGIPFGTFAGFILGAISGVIVKKFYYDKETSS